MNNIKIDVTGNIARVTKKPTKITSGTVGLPVEFTFDSQWDGLTKMAVFRAGNLVMAVDIPEAETTVPWELLEKPGVWLSVGVYGVNADGTIVIPTIWANVRAIIEGVEIDDEHSAEPTPSIWQRVAEYFVNLASKLFVKTVNGIEPDENGNVQIETGEGIDEISEVIEVTEGADETVVLFDSTEAQFDPGIIIANGTISTSATYIKTPALDVSGVGSVEVECNNFIPESATSERAFWMAQFDADGNMLTREVCPLTPYDSNGEPFTASTTQNLVTVSGVNRDERIATAKATVTMLDGATTLYFFNLKAGDSLDMVVSYINEAETHQKRMIKQDALPPCIEAQEAKAIANEAKAIAEKAVADFANCAEYVEPLVNDIALAAKAHMKADSMCIVLYTDTHYTAADTCYQTEIARQLAEATNATAIVHLGDLAHMHTEGKEIGVNIWKKHSRILQKTKIPYLQVVGNHDDANIYLHNVSHDYSAENYLSVADLYFATTKQSRSHITMGSLSGGYFYLDDEDSKTRIIVLNSHEYKWEVNADGVLMYDSNAHDRNTEAENPESATPPHGIMAVYSPEQMLWLANVALNFTGKENESEWSVIALAHMGTSSWANVNVLFQDFKTGTKCTRFGGYGGGDGEKMYDYSSLKASLTNDFSTAGARKIAFFTGDSHWDKENTSGGYPVVNFLNASPAKDQTIAPTKTKGTPTETAISVLVVTPSENAITELRFGAGTKYDADGNALPYNPLTDFDNYRVFEY